LKSTTARLARALDRLDPEPAPKAEEISRPARYAHTIRTNAAENDTGRVWGTGRDSLISEGRVVGMTGFEPAIP
jgi:hypothetical protein